MTKEEIKKLSRRSKSYSAMEMMVENLSDKAQSDEELAYQARCGTMPILKAKTEQKIIRAVMADLKSELQQADKGIEEFEKEYGDFCTNIFIKHFKYGVAVDELAAEYGVSSSTIKRRAQII